MSLQGEVAGLKLQLTQKDSDIEAMSKRVTGGIDNSPQAREQMEKQQEDEGKASGAARAQEKTRKSMAEFAKQIYAGVDTTVLNPADRLRAERSYLALIDLQKSSAGDEGDALGGKRLALLEVDDAAMEALLGKVRTTAGEKTGKTFEFSTEEALLRHVLNILEVAAPTRKVLLGDLVENTIEEATYTVDSRYN